jgi:hypothetical protein
LSDDFKEERQLATRTNTGMLHPHPLRQQAGVHIQRAQRGNVEEGPGQDVPISSCDAEVRSQLVEGIQEGWISGCVRAFVYVWQ